MPHIGVVVVSTRHVEIREIRRDESRDFIKDKAEVISLIKSFSASEVPRFYKDSRINYDDT